MFLFESWFCYWLTDWLNLNVDFLAASDCSIYGKAVYLAKEWYCEPHPVCMTLNIMLSRSWRVVFKYWKVPGPSGTISAHNPWSLLVLCRQVMAWTDVDVFNGNLWRNLTVPTLKIPGFLEKSQFWVFSWLYSWTIASKHWWFKLSGGCIWW